MSIDTKLTGVEIARDSFYNDNIDMHSEGINIASNTWRYYLSDKMKELINSNVLKKIISELVINIEEFFERNKKIFDIKFFSGDDLNSEVPDEIVMKIYIDEPDIDIDKELELWEQISGIFDEITSKSPEEEVNEIKEKFVILLESNMDV